MHARVVGELGVEGDHDDLALARGDRMAVDVGEHLDVRAGVLDPRRADEHRAHRLVGGLLGAVIIPPFSDRQHKRKKFLLLGTAFSIPGFIGVTFATTFWLLLVSGFALGFFLNSFGFFIDGSLSEGFTYTPTNEAPWHLLTGVLRSDSFAAGEKLEVLSLGRVVRSAREGDHGAARLSVSEWLARQGQSESLRRNFWDLLCIAALNEDPRVASAELFARVLRLALFQSAGDSCLGIARVGLSDCYTQAAADYIVAHGGTVELGKNITGLTISSGACTGVVAGAEKIESATVICAVPWTQFVELVPGDLFSWQSLSTVRGLLLTAGGGFLVGFGTRYAEGCTSGHSIHGLATLQPASLVATVCFFAGGLAATYGLMPFILRL